MDQLQTGTRQIMKAVRDKLYVEKYDMADGAWVQANQAWEAHTNREFNLERL